MYTVACIEHRNTASTFVHPIPNCRVQFIYGFLQQTSSFTSTGSAASCQPSPRKQRSSCDRLTLHSISTGTCPCAASTLEILDTSTSHESSSEALPLCLWYFSRTFCFFFSSSTVSIKDHLI